MSKIYDRILKQSGRPQLALLIDPEKYNPEVVRKGTMLADMFFVGGSTLKKGQINKTITAIKKLTKKPVIIFPGDYHQVDKNADAILFLSLISGRDSEYLIGKHVKAASEIKAAKLEAIPTGYILVDGERISETQRVSGSIPLPSKNIKEIERTAIAGELLGMKLIYLEAGSGARKNISASLIRRVKKSIDVPLIVGGGINTAKKAQDAFNAGADIVVIGNALEKNIHLLDQFSSILDK